jgi:hypothetical protein
MTLGDLKKALMNRLSSIRSPANTVEVDRQGYINGLPESDYQRRLRLSPEQRYQDIKRQSMEHKENRYYKYHKIYNEFYKLPQDGNYQRAYNIASHQAESRFKQLYPTDELQGCVTNRCVRSCRFYADTGTISDQELKELMKQP